MQTVYSCASKHACEDEDKASIVAHDAIKFKSFA